MNLINSYLNYNAKNEIKSRLDIVELISETVQLSRKGNNYWGLCPFHQEKTPSFSVSRDKQMFYYFGCHAGGDIFDFMIKRDDLEFKESLEILAAKAGVEINSTHKTTRARIAARKAMQEHQKIRKQEDGIEALIDAEYKRLLIIRDWFETIIKTVEGYGEDCLLAFERPCVQQAYENKDRLNYWLDEFDTGTDEDRLELIVVTRRWNPWGAI